MTSNKDLFAEIRKYLLPNDKQLSKRSSKKAANIYKTYKNVHYILYGIILIVILLVGILLAQINTKIRETTSNPDKSVETLAAYTELAQIRFYLLIILFFCIFALILTYFERYRPYLSIVLKSLACFVLFYVLVDYADLTFKYSSVVQDSVITTSFKTLMVLTLVVFVVLCINIIFTKQDKELLLLARGY